MKRLKSGKRVTKVTELRDIIAKVRNWATLPPESRNLSEGDGKTRKSDGIMVKVGVFLDHLCSLPYRLAWCLARDRLPEEQEC